MSYMEKLYAQIRDTVVGSEGMQLFEDVRNHNRAVNELMRRANVRAGQRVFELMNVEQMDVWLAQRLPAGVCCLSDLKREDWAKIMLPVPDRDQVEHIFAENPESITVQGEEFIVRYDDPPRIKINVSLARDSNGYEFVMCLDEEIYLPNGRPISISLRRGSSWGPEICCNSDIEQIKHAATDYMNRQQFNAYQRDKWPQIPVPLLDGDDAEIPALLKHVYGKDAYDGSDLIAWGTTFPAELHLSYSYTELHLQGFVRQDNFNFQRGWFYDPTGAQAARDHAVARLEEVKAERCLQQRRNSLEHTAKQLITQLCTLAHELCVKFISSQQMADLAGQLRGHAGRHMNTWKLPLTELEKWCAESERLVQVAQEALAKPATNQGTVHNARKADDKSIAHRNFGGVYKKIQLANEHSAVRVVRLHDCSFYWVVELNGEQRKPDHCGPMLAGVGDGVMTWDYILNEEVALQLLRGGKFKVVHKPAKPTPAQRTTIERIEKEIGAQPGTFGV